RRPHPRRKSPYGRSDLICGASQLGRATRPASSAKTRPSAMGNWMTTKTAKGTPSRLDEHLGAIDKAVTTVGCHHLGNWGFYGRCTARARLILAPWWCCLAWEWRGGGCTP